MGKRILVCGGRDFSDQELIKKILSEYRDAGAVFLVHGDARGADRLAAKWALALGFEVEAYPANWKLYGRAAGPVRNAYMLTMGKPDIVVAFSGGRGTADMVNRARIAGVPIREVR